MSGTHKYTWEKRQIDIPDAHSRDYNKIPIVNLKGHQSSGARAPELWCLYIFLVFSWLCILIYAGSVLCNYKMFGTHTYTWEKDQLIFL